MKRCLSIAVVSLVAGLLAGVANAQEKVATTQAATTQAANASGADVFAATGLSKKTDVMAGAEEATKAMMDAFKASGKKPGAVIFLERVAEPGKFAGKGKQIGDKVKELAGGAPTFGHGGTSEYGLTLGADVKDKDSTFLVLGIAAPGLEAKGYATGGKIEYSYPAEKRPDDVEKAKQWEQDVAKEKVLRETAKTRGKQLGAMIPKLSKPGVVVFMGALHNNWHVTFLEGLREAVGEKTPVIGGVGRWDDYVYNNGDPVKTADGKDAPAGQLAVVIQGDMQVVLAGAVCEDKYKKEGVAATIEAVAKKGLAGLNGKKPAAVIAFSCVTLLRDSKVMDPSVLYAQMSKLYGPTTPLFGCFCGGEAGTANDGKFTAGGDRFMTAVIAEK